MSECNKRNPLQHLTILSLTLVLFAFAIYSLGNPLIQSGNLLQIFSIYLPISYLLELCVITFLGNQKIIPSENTGRNSVVILVQLAALLIVFLFFEPGFVSSISGWIIAVITIVRLCYLACLFIKSSPELNVTRQGIVLFFLTLSLLIPLSGWRTASRPLDGDEPYFLLMLTSMIQDHDINLENNYINGDSLTFTHRKLEPQQFDGYSDGKLVSRHPPLMALFLLPGFLMAGKSGAILTIAFFSALLAVCLLLTGSQLGFKPDVYIPITLTIVFTGSILLYSQALFTELPAALFTLIVFYSAIKITQKKQASFWVILGCIVILAMLKIRFLSLVIPPVITAFIIRGEQRSKLFRILVFLFLSVTAIGIFNTIVYDSPFIRYSLEDLTGINSYRLFRGGIGLLWDQQYGIIPLNPVMLFVFPGLVILCLKKQFNILIIWLAAIVPYYFAVAAFAELTGGICPRSRFLTAWIPVFSIPLFYVYQQLKSKHSQALFHGFSILSGVVAFLLTALPSWQIVFPGSADKMLWNISSILGIDMIHAIPSFDRVDENLLLTGFIFCTVILAGTVLTLLFCQTRQLSLSQLKTGSVLIALAAIVTAGTTGFLIQTEWMDSEDSSFTTSSNTQQFWEETKSWDYITPSKAPYRSGIRLFSQGSVTRSLPFRSGFVPADYNALEIIARGSVPKLELPSLMVMAGDEIIGHIRMKSSQMESYYCRWPYGNMRIAPALKLVCTNKDSGWVDIDRIRLVERSEPWPIKSRNANRYLPVKSGKITINSIDLPGEPIEQGKTFLIHLNIDQQEEPDHPGNDYCLVFKNGSRTFFHDISDSTLKGSSIDLHIKIPVEKGNGEFNVLFEARDSRHRRDLIAPIGLHSYDVGKRAWLGRIKVEPRAVNVVEGHKDLLSKRLDKTDKNYWILPLTGHLQSHTSIDIDLEEAITFNRVVILSHLTEVYEEIPFQSVLAELIIKSPSDKDSVMFTIGKHTAEDMYLFGGKEIRLSHEYPEILFTEDRIIRWPLVLENTHYDSLFFYAGESLEQPVTSTSITINTRAFPGVFNIFAIALVEES